MSSRNIRKSALCIAVGCCMASMATLPVAYAQSASGTIAGRADPGAQVTITSPDTGFTRTVTADAEGGYRFPYLPTGAYTVQSSRDGTPSGAPVDVRVGLGNASTVNLGAGATNMAAIEVIGARGVQAVDVSSTESATNVTAEEIARLPVDRDVASVALLAPGVSQGGAGFGGLSFGGSSVAENSFYVNGLNVSDFYNRIGFSEAPFSFYKEFQIKTGGYSVEFGRTTGGVVNAVAKTGTNEFHYGTEFVWEPDSWQASRRDSYLDGERYISRSQDFDDAMRLNLWASGPIIRDRLFFFAMYEGRRLRPEATGDDGESLTRSEADDGFWGTTLDWQVSDNNLLSLVAFSNRNRTLGNVYAYDYDGGEAGEQENTLFDDTGGRNWALTWSSYLTDSLSMKLMHGRNERDSKNSSPMDDLCNYVTAAAGVVNPGIRRGCTTNASVYDREDQRKQTRADFEWSLGDHLLRFGADREANVSDLAQVYPGPGGVQYNVYTTTPGASIPSSGGGIVPPGYFAYVRARQYSVSGNFETTNSAYYLEDNWSVTDDLVLSLGVRQEGFDNKDAEGRSYIRMDDMWAPRLGFSWDMRGDGTTKLFGNAGRYYLPVANVINIKQAGALLDARTYYGFDGWETLVADGMPYASPILGPQFGFFDGQGNGTVGDLRAEVDRDMDPVYQDEFILGFQQQLGASWSWGARGIYRELKNAIDDIEITATAACGPDGAMGYVMANPGEVATVWGDSDCDGTADGWIDIDTANEGWAMYDETFTYERDADGDLGWTRTGSNYLGQRGYEKPRRDYKALELQADRAWDGSWALNASYTLSFSEGNAEGPVNTDTNFGDTGRTENFDDPWVNHRADGPLANDHRHQFKLRGTYALGEYWRVGGTLDARSGAPITAFGVGNPFDATAYHSYYICESQCAPPDGAAEGDTWNSSQRVYSHSARGGEGRLPWTFDLGASVAYERDFGAAHFRAKLAFFNLLNQQRPVWVYQELEPGIGDRDAYFGKERFLQSPRYGQLTLALSF